ncbi:MAG: MerR family transcriptional regulator [Angustibacter sp.]
MTTSPSPGSSSAGLLSIGQFARASHLSVKTLRHYHDVGVLVPADVDPGTGYRRYAAGQVADAQLVRRFRDLDMPLEDVRSVLTAADPRDRSRLVLRHLDRMERHLDRAHAAVVSLRSLLTDPGEPLVVEERVLSPTPVFAVSGRTDRHGIDDWCAAAFGDLGAALEATGVAPTGPGGGLYPGEFFEDAVGEVTAYLPVGSQVLADPPGRVRLSRVAGQRVAVALHLGPYRELDRTYGALGAHLAGRTTGGDGPIRERYLVGPPDTDDPQRWRTEVCWPIAAP